MRAALFRDNFSPCQALAAFPSRAGLNAAARSLSPTPDRRPPPSARPGQARPYAAGRGRARSGRAEPCRARAVPPRGGARSPSPARRSAPVAPPGRARHGWARHVWVCTGRSVLFQKETRRTSPGAAERSQKEPCLCPGSGTSRAVRVGAPQSTEHRTAQTTRTAPGGAPGARGAAAAPRRALQGVLQPRSAKLHPARRDRSAPAVPVAALSAGLSGTPRTACCRCVSGQRGADRNPENHGESLK